MKSIGSSSLSAMKLRYRAEDVSLNNASTTEIVALRTGVNTINPIPPLKHEPSDRATALWLEPRSSCTAATWAQGSASILSQTDCSLKMYSSLSSLILMGLSLLLDHSFVLR